MGSTTRHLATLALTLLLLLDGRGRPLDRDTLVRGIYFGKICVD